MAAVTSVCKFHRTGYCKFQTTCQHIHIDDICQDNSCSGTACNLRHPRICKYFLSYGRCKFGQKCAYHHKNLVDEVEVDKIRRELENLSNQIQKLDRMQTKLEEIESKISTSYEEQDSTEQPLKTRVYEVEQNVYLLANSIDSLEASNKLLNWELETLKEDLRKFTCSGRGNSFESHPIQAQHMQKRHDAGKSHTTR